MIDEHHQAAMKLSFPLEHRYRIFSSSKPSPYENKGKVHTVDWVSLRGQRRKEKNLMFFSSTHSVIFHTFLTK